MSPRKKRFKEMLSQVRGESLAKSFSKSQFEYGALGLPRIYTEGTVGLVATETSRKSLHSVVIRIREI
jgi:hypothetical protein